MSRTTSHTEVVTREVTIVGAGQAGLLLGIGLLKKGFGVTIVTIPPTLIAGTPALRGIAAVRGNPPRWRNAARRRISPRSRR